MNISNVNTRPRKNSQIVSLGSGNRVYTPDQMYKIYDESLSKNRGMNSNGSVSNKNKKAKRGAKTSYGNYSQFQMNPFMTSNNLKWHKARKSLVASTGSKKNMVVNNSHIIESLK